LIDIGKGKNKINTKTLSPTTLACSRRYQTTSYSLILPGKKKKKKKEEEESDM
jgi:hypothetical protein